MKKIFLTILLILTGTAIYAQDKEKPLTTRPLNNINLNFLGDMSFISLDYERLLIGGQIFLLTAKLGVGYTDEIIMAGTHDNNTKYLTVPHHITANIGKKRHFAEIGLGGTAFLGQETTGYMLYPIVGYRLQPLKTNNIDLRVYFNYPFETNYNVSIEAAVFGVCVGVSF